MHHSTVSARTGPGGGGGTNMMSYLLNGAGSAIKPSVSFVSMARKDYKQHHYTDEQDGPSSLQIIGNEHSRKDERGGADNWYEIERSTHCNEIPAKTACLDDVKKMLYTDYRDNAADMAKTLLTMPSAKRAEVRIAKEKLEEFAKFKENHKYVGRRERVIKNGWRHGITGLDNADSENTSIFYQDSKKRKDLVQSEKDRMNTGRLQKLKISFGTSSQVPVSSETYKRTRSLL